MQKIISRVQNIILRPRETWQEIKGETTSIQELFINYAVPLALIPFIANLIGFSLVGLRMPMGVVSRVPFAEALVVGVVGYIIGLLGILIGAWVVNLIAPYFSAKQDFLSALKIVVYSMTPVWIVGVFGIIPGLGILQILGLYGVYLLYLGLPVLMENPTEKTLWYTIAIVAVGFVVSLVLSAILSAFYGPIFMRMMAR